MARRLRFPTACLQDATREPVTMKITSSLGPVCFCISSLEGEAPKGSRSFASRSCGQNFVLSISATEVRHSREMNYVNYRIGIYLTTIPLNVLLN